MKTGDQFTQAYTELIERVNDLSLVRSGASHPAQLLSCS